MQCSKLIKHFNILIVVTSYRCQNHHLTILTNIYAYTISLCLHFSCTNNRIIISSFIWIRVWKLASFSGKGGVPINRVYELYSTTMLKISLLLAGYTEKFNSVTSRTSVALLELYTITSTNFRVHMWSCPTSYPPCTDVATLPYWTWFVLCTTWLAICANHLAITIFMATLD